MTDERQPCEDAALFVTDRELHRRINPALPYEKFRAAVAAAERDESFPKAKALWGGRYWPAAQRWFEKTYGVTEHGALNDIQDGPETFDAAPRRKARLQARPPAERVLDRAPGREGHDGLPRLVHSAAAGRK